MKLWEKSPVFTAGTTASDMSTAGQSFALQRPSATNMQMNTENFSSLLVPDGEMYLSGHLPEEADEPDIAGFQRLVLDFNRCDYGQLRKLIDAVNDH